MWERSFFRNDVTTLTTYDRVQIYENDIIRITIRDTATQTTTGGTLDVDYVVKRRARSSAYIIDVTPAISNARVDYFPSRRELNDRAAQQGAEAQKPKHSRIPKKALVLRSSYQGMARLPCYRGTRPR